MQIERIKKRREKAILFYKKNFGENFLKRAINNKWRRNLYLSDLLKIEELQEKGLSKEEILIRI